MREKRKGTTSSSRKARGMLKENFVYVKYSEIEDLRQKLSDASTALSHAAKSLADIKLTCTPPEVDVESLQRLMDLSDTNRRTLLHNRTSEPDAFGIPTDKTLKSIASPWADLQSGQTKKSRKK